MESALHVSTDALAHVEQALGRFESRAEELLASALASAQRELQVCAERTSSARDRVEYWQAAYDGADEDDDPDYYLDELAQAESELQHRLDLQAGLESALEHFQDRAGTLRSTLRLETPRARGKLREMVSAVESYSAFNVGLDHPGSSQIMQVKAPAGAPENTEVGSRIAQRLRGIAALNANSWATLSAAERQTALTEVAMVTCEELGIPPPNVTFTIQHPSLCGGFDRGLNINRVNVAARQSDEALWEDVCEMTDTIVHECRHAYQWRCAKGDMNDTMAETWSENFQDYSGPNDPLYRRQPVEADAWAFAANVIRLWRETEK